MTYTKDQVLKIIDSCFHMFASDYRIDAKETAIRIMENIEIKAVKDLNIPSAALERPSS